MHYFVGWDVGGWNCDKNQKSRDALAVLGVKDSVLSLFGEVFRGNIREQINSQLQLAGIINFYCKTEIGVADSITIAIDTPLGLPDAVVRLVSGGELPKYVEKNYAENPYLYRRTEFWLFEKGFAPLSAIKDMIGSQATKGMHLISKLALKTAKEHCGVWKAGDITAIETYPTPSMGSKLVKELYAKLKLALLTHDDKIHAVFCGLIAYLFATLVAPQGKPSISEGWIWIPADAIAEQRG